MNSRAFTLSIFLLLSLTGVEAQVTPNGQTVPNAATQVLNPIPSAYSSAIALNYVRSWEVERPLQQDSAVISPARTVQEVKQTTEYIDGLGRGLQTVAKGLSPAGYDLVTPVIYDPYGREIYKYQSYVSPSNNGNFKSGAFSEQNTFMAAYYNPMSDPNGERFFYNQQQFESSPLNRLLASYSAGNSWVGSGVGTQIQYAVNTNADSVVVWRIGYAAGYTPVSSNFYGYAQLMKNSRTDENGHQTILYVDKDGRIVLKKAQLSASPAMGPSGWLCTYYIYDDLGNLRWVIQPAGVQALQASGWVFDGNMWSNSSIARGWCFSYEYDDRNRMIIRRVPGSGEAWMVYDARDRMVMSQDSVLRSRGIWQFMQYDSLNRTVETGIWASSANRSYHQSLAAAAVNYPNPVSGDTIYTQTYYDNYNWVAGSSSGLSSSFISTHTGDVNYFYTPDNNNFPYPQPITATNMTNGMVTGHKLNVLGSTNYLYSVSFYDDRARTIQVQGTNYTGGLDTMTTQYSFSGQALRTLDGHAKGGSSPQGYLVSTKFTYDAAGRIAQVNKKIGNSPEVILSSSQYDELGQLKQKNIGQKRHSLTDFSYTGTALDSLKYVYNIRGWLQGINKDYANNVNGAANWFGMELNYDYGFSSSQLNGNIAGVKWRNNGDGAQRAYGLSYDAQNRLTRGDFTQYTGSAWSSNTVDFSVRNLNYDANGNILTMSQKGLKLNSVQLIDSLTYGYMTNSNQLSYVTDHVNDTSAHLGDFTEINNNATPDYAYDWNGNLLQDNNKGITSIQYNTLNMPTKVTVTNKGTVSYVYDASGEKLQKIVTDNTVSPAKTTTTTYIGTFVYKNDTLQFLGSEEGRVRPKNPAKSDTMYYDYFEKDHLDNTRVVLTDELVQDTYPVATVESNSASLAVEESYYSINPADTVNVGQIPGFTSSGSNVYYNNNGNPPYNTNPSSNTTAQNAVMYRLNGSTGDKTGLGITLKVMSGDVVDIYGKTYYHLNAGQTPNNNNLITAALNTFIASFAGTPAVTSVHGATAGALESSPTTPGGILSWLNSVPNPGSSSVPRAYINWILFDNQFNPVSGNSGFEGVGPTTDLVQSHHNTVTASKSGYLYIYCSNESDVDVFFDNLQVIQTRGPLLETTDYYPFGLTMAGISDKAMKTGYPENKYKFDAGRELQNKEFSDGSGLELYETSFRSMDPQLGRFWQVDPLAVLNQPTSPYAYCENNPVSFVDPLGLDTNKVQVTVPAGTKPETMIQVKTPTGGTSFYIYRPGDPNADEHGLVGVGQVNAPLQPTVVTPGGNHPDNSAGGGGTDPAPAGGGGTGGNPGGGGGGGHGGGGGGGGDPFDNPNPEHLDRDLHHMDPRVAPHVIDLVNRARDIGFPIMVNEGYRTARRQQYLYEQGRTRPGNIVTNAQAWHGNHNYGMAIDVVPLNSHGQPDWSRIVSPQVVQIARDEGFSWGGTWTHPDYPHFEMTFGQTISQLRQERGH